MSEAEGGVHAAVELRARVRSYSTVVHVVRTVDNMYVQQRRGRFGVFPFLREIFWAAGFCQW